MGYDSATLQSWYSGIAFGEWAKPRERLSDKEKEQAVIGRIKKNIELEIDNVVCYIGNAEQMGRLARFSDCHGFILEQHV